MSTIMLSADDRLSEAAAGPSSGERELARLNPEASPWLRAADAVRLVRGKWMQVMAVTAATVALGLGYALLATPRYESTTRLMPAPQSNLAGGMTPMTMGGPEMSALAGLIGLPGEQTNNERFVALLKSRVVADMLIDRFHLMDRYHARRRSEARAVLARHTQIQQDRKTAIISVTFADADPEFAARVAKEYVAGLEKVNIEMNTSGAHLERQFLDGRVKEVDDQIREASAHLSDFSSASGMLDPQSQPRSTVDEALKIEAQVIALRAQISGEEQVYTPEALKAPRARLAELERHLALLQGSQGEANNLPSVRSIPKLGAAFSVYARRVKLLEAVELYLTQMLEVAKTEEVKQLPVVRVMEPAEPPDQRVWPKRTIIVLAAFGMGLMLGVLFVLGREKWNAIDASDPVKALVRELFPARLSMGAVPGGAAR